MKKECPPQVKCCLNVLGCPNVRVSCGLADLPEEEQRVSLRQFHGQQFTLISRNCLGVSFHSDFTTGGNVHQGKETCLRQRSHRKPHGRKDVVCIGLSVLIWPGIWSRILITRVPVMGIVESREKPSDASGEAGSKQGCQNLGSQGKNSWVYSST